MPSAKQQPSNIKHDGDTGGGGGGGKSQYPYVGSYTTASGVTKGPADPAVRGAQS